VAKKRKAPEISPESTAFEVPVSKLEKESEGRRKNAEKQKRFRDSMKAEGYRRVTLWGLPSPADKRLSGAGFRQVPAWEIPQKNAEKSCAAKIALAVRIRESSMNAAARSPEVKKALAAVAGEFLSAIGNAPEGKAVYNDFLELIAPLGDPFGDK